MSERAAIREARILLATRDGGQRIARQAVTPTDFAEADYFPLLDSLASAGRRSARGVALPWTMGPIHRLPARVDEARRD